MEASMSLNYKTARMSNAIAVTVTLLILSACGGSTKNADQESAQDTDLQSEQDLSLSVAAIKGPLAFAAIRVYQLDTTFPGYYDPKRPIAEGQTKAAAQAPALTIDHRYSPPFVVVVDGSNAIDLNSGKYPVISSLTTIVTDDMASSGKTVYATPLTSLAHRMVEHTAGLGVTPSSVVTQLNLAAEQITSTLGIGMPSTVDILRDPPLLTADATSPTTQQEVAHHRAALEAVAAMTYKLSQVADVGTENILDELALDLSSDGRIDKSANGQFLPHIDLAVLRQDPSDLLIPDTTFTVKEVNALLNHDLAMGATDVAVTESRIALSLTPVRTLPSSGEKAIPNTDESLIAPDVIPPDSVSPDKPATATTTSAKTTPTTTRAVSSTTRSPVSTTRSTSSTTRTTTAPQSTTTTTRQQAILDRRDWSLRYVDSQELTRQNGAAVNAIDGNPTTFWHTEWSGANSELPHEIQIDTGTVAWLTGLRYLPRQDAWTYGWIKGYEIYVSDDGASWGNPVSAGALVNSPNEQTVEFLPVLARYVRFVATSELKGRPYTSAAEITLLGAPVDGNRPPAATISAPASNVTVTQGSAIRFAGSGSDLDGGKLRYRWSFGDSGIASSTAQNPGEIIFPRPGTYTVTLSVTDPQGSSDATPPTRVITVAPASVTTTTTTATTTSTTRVPSTTTSTQQSSTTTSTRAATTTTSTRATTTTTRAPSSTTTTRQASTTTSTRATTTTTSTTTTTVSPRNTPDDPVDWTDLVGNTTGNIYFVASESEFNATAAVARPGDAVIVRNGVYTGWRLRIPSKGTADQPIIYTAQSSRGVTIKGAHTNALSVTGSHNIIGGFVFDGTGLLSVQLRGATRNRITDSAFLSCGDSTKSLERIIEITEAADNNRIDHSLFENSRSTSIGFRLPRPGIDTFPTSLNNRIDHNVFRGIRDALTIQIGSWQGKDDKWPDSSTIVEYNEFRSSNSMVVNSKSNGETHRFNHFYSIKWEGLSLRGGDNKRVEGNYFEDVNIPVIVYGRGHTIINNVMIRPGIGIQVPKWGEYQVQESGKTGYSPPTGDMLIAHNTLVNASYAGIELGRTWGYVDRPGWVIATKLPTNLSFINNILVSNQGTLFLFIDGGAINVSTNLFHASDNGKIGYLGHGAIESSPLFGNDYRLSDGSVAIDAGAPLPEVKFDAAQQPRVSGKKPDLGAYEYRP